MTVILNVGETLDLHNLETNGTASDYEPAHKKGSSLTYAGMPNEQTISFIYTTFFNETILTGNLYFPLRETDHVHNEKKSKLEIKLGNMTNEVSEITPQSVRIQVMTTDRNKRP